MQQQNILKHYYIYTYSQSTAVFQNKGELNRLEGNIYMPLTTYIIDLELYSEGNKHVPLSLLYLGNACITGMTKLTASRM